MNNSGNNMLEYKCLRDLNTTQYSSVHCYGFSMSLDWKDVFWWMDLSQFIMSSKLLTVCFSLFDINSTVICPVCINLLSVF
jgi:hypothetical protein